MRFLYTLVLYLAAPFLYGRLLWQALIRRDDWRRIPERFGHVNKGAGEIAVWVHAVSVGEFMAAQSLIRALVAAHPGAVLVTTTTTTASARVREQLQDSVLHCYAPYDLPHVVSRFLDRIHPRRVVIMETELWPNLFRALRARGIPLLIANGRLSPRSFPHYRRFRVALARVLDDCTLIAAQSEADAGRFRALGAEPSRVQVMGNLKFDFELPAGQVAQGRALRERLGAGRTVWIAASTHDREEQAALAAHAHLLESFPQALLILVPRHPPRFDAVARRIEDSGLGFARRSALGDWSSASVPATAAVLLGDSMGEMAAYYAMAEVAFVGGSLVPIGGHNVLEPAALGIPVLFGPHMFNFEAARGLLLESRAARQVEDSTGLADAVAALWRNADARVFMGRAGQVAVGANRGALRRFLGMLQAAAA